MREQIENHQREQATKHLQDGVEGAQYVQLDTWFGDVWARILHISIPSQQDQMARFASITYVTYDKYGKCRQLRSTFLGDVRRLAKELPANAGIVHDLAAHRSYGRITPWPTPAALRITPYTDERHPALTTAPQ